MSYPMLHAIPLTRAPAPAPPAPAPRASEPAPFRVLNGSVYFNGKCDDCRPFCGSVCCRGYTFVSLTEEEAKSGRFVFKEAEEACGCDTCSRMREAGIRYALYKRSDGACFYLDGNGRCSVYADRPETCRQYSCTRVAFRITP